ncbi:malic enzyme-like NAD(P)-binding protein [Halodesulfovibrio aestuarii]|uniref:Malate dehydrogenase (Oxaloacetate-decarboxylating)(NADP+) n=1 Tax=Halodesulfovibrio aestuarii TaxID=126333 RepID=A0A8G2FHL3_9BACT|nr:malic enzyme-like NAD(P)-binding protein [Halodesulfovibrio aestuarii]SHJ02039.1 malate dehydrogenase (oxaloacetate-decarboxylating)(NADP+) [Halodesulfovibrio aestuarii]
MALFTKEEALEYHKLPRRGKVEVVPVKPCVSQKDLSMAYSPGVAEACKAIHADPAAAALYTGKSNLVAVVSNGTAVLGLGNIGPLAGKPVMEGKGVLFKTFADIDVFDINLDVSDSDELIKIVKAMEPTFGGINLEDIKAPECFYIEETLKKMMNIPVFHDDQHGTAVISGAGLISACEITNRKMEDLKVVVVGAGAAGIACTKFYVQMGIDPKNIFMFDSRGLIHKGRTDLNPYKAEFAQAKDLGSLEEVIKGADCFLGLSTKGLLSKDMVRSMAKDPVIFAMANPDPEITYDDAKEASPACIMGTGRSDYPNQINNVSGFPYIFRGALDVGATIINEEMKVAAAQALADLAKEPVPSEICDAYGVKSLSFGIDYIIPKPLDPRVLEWEVPAVAQAAMDTGVATMPIQDMEAYKNDLKQRITASHDRIAPFVASYYK